MSALALRSATPEDEAFLLALYASTREDLAVLGLAAADRARLVEMQFSAQRQTYRAVYPAAVHSVVLVAERPAGAVLVDRSADPIRIVDIVLLPEQRGAGIGRRVLEGVLAEALATSRSVEIRVAQGSRALRLYRRLGFIVTASEPPYLALCWTPRERAPELAHAKPEFALDWKGRRPVPSGTRGPFTTCRARVLRRTRFPKCRSNPGVDPGCDRSTDGSRPPR